MNTIYKGVSSTSVCFLDNKPNITIIPETFIKKIILEDGTAQGVDVCEAAFATTIALTAGNRQKTSMAST